MGRLKKYKTLAEKQAIKRAVAKKYYWDNKEQCDEKQRKRDKIKKKRV
jgi:hypothetical protein